MTREDIAKALEETAAANGMTTDVHCRLMVTRGTKVKPFQHPSLSRTGPTIVIIMEHSKAIDRTADSGTSARGIKLASVPQVDEGLMLDPHGFVNTTNACNFFVVKKGEVWTSSGDYCMNGVTRQKVIDLCRDAQIPVFEKNYSLYEAYGADEAFLTGTFGAQTPVYSIDGQVIGSGKAGPVTKKIRALYKMLVDEYVQEAALISDYKK